FAADDTLGRADASAIDENSSRPMRGGGLVHSCLAACGVGHIAGDCDSLKLRGDIVGGLFIDVDNCNLGACGCQGAGRCGAEARRSACDDCSLSFDFHQSIPPATITCEESAVL